MRRFLKALFFSAGALCISLSFQGCENLGGNSNHVGSAGPSIWVARYEVQIAEGDISRNSKEERGQIAQRRESAVRAIVTEFGGALVEVRPITDYTHDSAGNVVANSVWKITVDVDEGHEGEFAREIRRRIGAAFGGTPDVWIVRYPVQKILN